MVCIYLNCMRKVWFVFLMVLSVPAFAAVEVKGGKVTANVQSELLRDVINQIGTQAGVQVSIDDSISNDMVYANFQDLPVGAAIRKLLEGIDVNYAVIAGGDGNPTAIYVSKSASPGAPPKKLDSRPIAAPARGVVTPVMPQAPQPVMPQQNVIQQQNVMPQQPVMPQPNIPQGGNYRNPATQPNPANQPNPGALAPGAQSRSAERGRSEAECPAGWRKHPHRRQFQRSAAPQRPTESRPG